MKRIARALQRAHVFACVESTLCFQLWASSANRSAFARYALSAHASRSAVLRWWFAEVARKIENLGDKRYAIVQTCKRAGWFLVEQYKSGSRYQIIQWSTTTNKLQSKNKIKTKSEQPQHKITRNRQSVVRQETPSPHTTLSRKITCVIFASRARQI